MAINFWNSKFNAIVQSTFIKPFNSFVSFFTNWFKPKRVIKDTGGTEMLPLPETRLFNKKEIEILDTPVSINVGIKFMNRNLGYFIGRKAAQIKRDKEALDTLKTSTPQERIHSTRTFSR